MNDHPAGTSAPAPLYTSPRRRALWVVCVVFSAGLLAPPLFLGARQKGLRAACRPRRPRGGHLPGRAGQAVAAQPGGTGSRGCSRPWCSPRPPTPQSREPDGLAELLPQWHRLRDAEAGEPLRALLAVLAEQVDLVRSGVEGQYDDWFEPGP